MFTGIIEQSGTLDSIATDANGVTRVSVRSPLAERLKIGDSIAVNGVCLTAIEVSTGRFSADLLQETLARTTLGRLTVGAQVNLELPTPAGAPLGGHIVQGHVDAVGQVTRLALEEGTSGTWRFAVKLPHALMSYVAEKGSIAIDGISLTVAALGEDAVEMAIIPHTYAVTNIAHLKPGDEVNVETDPLAKYAESLRRSRSTLTLASLIERGY